MTMGVYKDPTENRTFYSPDREPTVNLSFQVWHITGLDNNAKPHPLYVKKSDYAKAHGIDPKKVHSNATGSGPGGSFLGSDMRAAYYQGSALTGTGQNIALFELAGSDLVDLSNVLQQRWANRTLHSHPRFHRRIRDDLRRQRRQQRMRRYRADHRHDAGHGHGPRLLHALYLRVRQRQSQWNRKFQR